jgi:type II secretion system protein N
MGSFKTISAYFLYAIFIVGIFLYLQFPMPAVRAYLDGRLKSINPELALAMETVSPAFLPPGLKVVNARVSRGEKNLVRIDRARVSPELLILFKKMKKTGFEADLAGGEIHGQAVLDGKKPSGHVQITTDFSQVHLERIDAVANNERFSLSGPVEGQATYEGNLSGVGGKTNGSFTVPDLRIKLQTDLFGINELLMGQTQGTISAKGFLLRVKSLTFDGPMAEGKITGTINVKRPFGDSRLNLTGNAKPRPELIARLQETIPAGFLDSRTLGTRGLNFRIGGTAQNPDVSLR